MILSAHKLIYVHIPKTGGNSVQAALLLHSDDQKVVHPFQDGMQMFEIGGGITPYKHASLREYYALMGANMIPLHVVCTVRHPFDRLVSFYFSPHRWLSKIIGEGPQDPTFEEAKFIRLAKSLVPMHDFLNVEEVIHMGTTVLRFEDLDADFAELTNKWLSSVDIKLPHLNKTATSQGLVRDVCKSVALRQLVEPYLRKDLDAFDYEI